MDLFAGIGGFHAALEAMGGTCVYAVEIDPAAAEVYERNWGLRALGDITEDANDDAMKVPRHDVLCAGFPCQPFSKSGAQMGMEETRGTLFWNILKIIQERRPAVVLLENVRNLAGPRHRHEWEVIINALRAEGYRVAEKPAVFSPHLLPRSHGGRPQVRERVFITATRVPSNRKFSLNAEPAVFNSPMEGWDPSSWVLERDLPLDPDHQITDCSLSESESLWIDAWDDLVQQMSKRSDGRPLPGFPLWADHWVLPSSLKESELDRHPLWKAQFLVKNAEFYAAHKTVLDDWATRWGVFTDAFPSSRRKFEWQAQSTTRLWDTVMHFRPSGIRAKRATYLPALVAISQTSIVGSRRRRLSPHEAARLQGFPEWFDFGDQRASETYRQLGNGVSIGAVWHVFRSHVMRDSDILTVTRPKILEAVLGAPASPDEILESLGPRDLKNVA